jgi:hypothetical protein
MTPQTAGLCIAARLTENPDVQVLVLEAGGTNLDEKDLDVLRACSSINRLIASQPHAQLAVRPMMFGAHFGNANFDWGFETVSTVASRTPRAFSELPNCRSNRSTAATGSIPGRGGCLPPYESQSYHASVAKAWVDRARLTSAFGRSHPQTNLMVCIILLAIISYSRGPRRH